MTHRVFSRNAGSSRARPTKAIRKQVWSDPWGPLAWGLNEPGMQAHTTAGKVRTAFGKWTWRAAAKGAAVASWVLEKLGFHKQICNRVLEPFTFIDVVLTATDYQNFFELRIDKDADPSIFDLANRMAEDYHTGFPKFLGHGEWHMPYINKSDINQVKARYG